jgi:hypothetical protein
MLALRCMLERAGDGGESTFPFPQFRRTDRQLTRYAGDAQREKRVREPTQYRAR